MNKHNTNNESGDESLCTQPTEFLEDNESEHDLGDEDNGYIEELNEDDIDMEPVPDDELLKDETLTQFQRE